MLIRLGLINVELIMIVTSVELMGHAYQSK